MSSAPFLPSGRHGLDSFVQYAKTYGAMLRILNRHVIFDTEATSDSGDYNTVSSSSYYYLIRQFCLWAMLSSSLPPSLPHCYSLFLSFPHSLWGAFV